VAEPPDRGNLWNAQQRLAQRAQGKRHAFHRRHSVRVHAARVVRGDILASDVANAAKDLERHQTTLEKCERLTAATQR